MKAIQITEHVSAPPERVFAAASDFAHAAERIPGISKIELLTPGPTRLGTRFRESRRGMGTEELEVTRFDPPRALEISARSCGCTLATEFRFTPEGPGTRVEVALQSQAHTLFARLLSPLAWLMSGLVKRCLQNDLAALKRFCEQPPA